jgi:serine phosphatase RsbU (regulator of sigma subunit)
VGGDFFSILHASETAAGVFVCDVMGHGMRAALITAIIRGLLEELRPAARDAGAFLTQVNRGLTKILKQADQLIFASAIYAVIDLNARVLSFASAGHPCPVHVSAAQQVVRSLTLEEGVRGPALGLEESRAYRPCRYPLEVGDLIVFFTDGICEIRDRDGREFGDVCLLPAMRKGIGASADQMFDEMIREAARFSETEELEDDVCLVGVEVTRRLAKAWEREASA